MFLVNILDLTLWRFPGHRCRMCRQGCAQWWESRHVLWRLRYRLHAEQKSGGQCLSCQTAHKCKAKPPQPSRWSSFSFSIEMITCQLFLWNHCHWCTTLRKFFLVVVWHTAQTVYDVCLLGKISDSLLPISSRWTAAAKQSSRMSPHGSVTELQWDWDCAGSTAVQKWIKRSSPSIDMVFSCQADYRSKLLSKHFPHTQHLAKSPLPIRGYKHIIVNLLDMGFWVLLDYHNHRIAVKNWVAHDKSVVCSFLSTGNCYEHHSFCTHSNFQ